MTHQVLLTSVCRPLGVRHGDSPSVGYELLHEQVTRAQGLFSPRSHHTQFSLEYIAENLEAPTVVLQYPSRRELIRELRRGYDVVGVSFVLATYHRMKEVVALVRKYSPQSKIVLGGYGTVAPDEMLRPYGDHICREEGVGFMRRLLGEPEIRMPYRHPLIINRLQVFGKQISRTGIVFGGLGCPNGCDFCCTSHFFKRKHIRLLPTGADIYQVVERYLEVDPKLSILIMDEDFLLNRRRAMEFRECVLRGGKPLSIFVFASVRALSQYTVTEILEMGIDGMWIGYEGTRSGYAKQSGRPVEEIFREFREHGITILASMIVGFPYQTPEIIEEELSGLLALRPVLTQFLIYGPCPGTPFYDASHPGGETPSRGGRGSRTILSPGERILCDGQPSIDDARPDRGCPKALLRGRFPQLGTGPVPFGGPMARGIPQAPGVPERISPRQGGADRNRPQESLPRVPGGQAVRADSAGTALDWQAPKAAPRRAGESHLEGAYPVGCGSRLGFLDGTYAQIGPLPAPAAREAYVQDVGRPLRAGLGAPTR